MIQNPVKQPGESQLIFEVASAEGNGSFGSMDFREPDGPLLYSRLGLHLKQMRQRVEKLGETVRFSDGELLCCSGANERVLYVIEEGEVDYGGGWLAAGAHLGELGFLLDQPRTATVRAKGDVVCWKMESYQLKNDPEASFHLVAALVRELPRRLQKFNSGQDPGEQPCDADHPAIVSVARALRSGDDVVSARNIWDFVRAMPYRFAPWWEKASDTLKAGQGMCTTKSNLQVALMRAANLEAGFVELTGSSKLILPVMPEKWKHRVGYKIRHYMAAVRIENEWCVADSSFTDAVLRTFAQQFPVVNSLFPCSFGPGKPFNPAALVSGQDPAPGEVLMELTQAMAKRSSFDLDQFELLNIVNDRLQGTVHDEPATLIRAWRLLPENPELALHIALGAAAILASELHQRITSSHEPI
ncbi:MAG: hypothetical protein RLZZ630_1544 [Bacteroidota bacterium]